MEKDNKGKVEEIIINIFEFNNKYTNIKEYIL